MRISDSALRAIAAPLAIRLAQAISAADKQLHDEKHVSAFMRAQWDARTWQANMQRAVVSHARALINPGTDPDVWWDSSTRVEWLHIRDQAVIRFKHLDESLLHRNNPTHQSEAFDDPDFPMKNMPPHVARLIVGWQTDPYIHMVQGRYIVEPNAGYAPYTWLSLDEMIAAQMLHIQRQRDAEKQAQRRFQIKQRGVDEDEKGAEGDQQQGES